MTEKGAKETYEKMSVASTEAVALIQNRYLTAVKGVQDYNNKFFEFAHENTNAAFDFIQRSQCRLRFYPEDVRREVAFSIH